MKKLCGVIILFMALILISNFAFANEYWDKENKKREEAFLYENIYDRRNT